MLMTVAAKIPAVTGKFAVMSPKVLGGVMTMVTSVWRGH